MKNCYFCHRPLGETVVELVFQSEPRVRAGWGEKRYTREFAHPDCIKQAVEYFAFCEEADRS